ncbi:MAG: TadE/TadG family type IV pilus assembly protein [Pseudomonadota bacterium]
MFAPIWNRVKTAYTTWRDSEEGMAAVESAMIFPVMLTLLVGTFDLGNGILANQKTIRASQVVADLVTRNNSLTTSGLDEAIEAGELALQPFNTSTFGIDVVSIRFDDDANPQIVWRETRNMAPVASILADVTPLAVPNGGVVVSTVEYQFQPAFAGFVVDAIQMQEKAFARGRKTAVINLN